MKFYHLIAFAFLLVSCATPPNKFDLLPEAEKARLQKSMDEIKKLDDCAADTKGNDAAFTTRCSKILAGKKLPARFRQANAIASTLRVQADVNYTTFFVCEATPTKALTEKIALLKEGDPILISGPVTNFTKYEEDVFKGVNKVKEFSYRLVFEPCTVSF